MADTSARTILVVEDNDSMRHALRDAIGRAGFTVTEAVDGQDGLRQALDNHPDLIVLDIMMPNMNGEEVLKKLRADAWGKEVPVIVLTNASFLQDEHSKQRTDEFLLKDATKLEVLVEKIRQHLA